MSYTYTDNKLEIKNETYNDTLSLDDAVPHVFNDENDAEKYTIATKIEFKNCTFKKKLSIISSSKEFTFEGSNIEGQLRQPNDINKIKFKNCTVSELNGRANIEGGTIKIFKLENTTFRNRFYINESQETSALVTIDSIKFEKVVFEKNFKLYHAKIKNISLLKCDFNGNADFTGSKFGYGASEQYEIIFSGIAFNQMLFMGSCTFCRHIKFKKVTFSSSVNFIKSKFLAGIDLENTTIKKEINFAGVKYLDDIKSIEKTPKETYRAIKLHFAKLNNKIEENTFRSLELHKNYTELQWNKKDFATKLIYSIHKNSSYFGSSWPRALCLVFFVGVIFTFVYICWYKWHVGIDINQAFKLPFQFMSIIHTDTSIKKFFNDNPVAYLLHKGILGYLYYQFIMAVRKDTKK